MGKMIDIDKARKEYSNLTDLTMSDTTLLLTLFGVLDNAPTVEAIPRADYEARLRADMVAMLTDMLIDVEEIASREQREQWCDYANDNCISRYDVEDLFQQKINSLKEVTP